ncbi:hypothetical protein KY285_010712 [Solanum tuberosum]|nr:hypothetical protein KY289_011293 [Solanum tuberosum]KAH0735005.1 hypothetical protein KY285_010712 [Solanum tuberosum]
MWPSIPTLKSRLKGLSLFLLLLSAPSRESKRRVNEDPHGATYSEWTSPFNFETASFVLPFVGGVGKRKRLDNYRADSDPTSKAYGLGHLTKLLMSGIHLLLILLSLASGLGVVKQGVSEIDPDQCS